MYMKMDRLFLIRFMICGWVLFSLSGCGIKHASRDAEKALSLHFERISTNGFEAGIADYGDSFYTKVSKEEWKKTLSNIHAKLGDYRSYSITSWHVRKQANATGTGIFVVLKCKTVYSRFDAQEQFTLWKGIGDSDYKIVGHSLKSKGL